MRTIKKKTENLNRQPQQKQHQQQNPDNKQEDKDKNPGRVQEQVFTSGEPYNVKPIRLEKEKEEISGSGRRSESESRNKSGRYIKSSIPKGKTADLAFDATIRAAAPYQVIREKNGNALTLEKQDIREKVRKKKTGSTILFVVDSSGSMGINKRMAETKTAIFSLLVDAYQKRDKVGMLVFKQNNAELILSPTSSVELARKQLETIPTGGKTPLSKGLLTGYECMLKEMNKYKSIKPVIVLISDGKANVSIASGAKPFEEAKHIAEQIRRSGIKTIVIDTETGFLRLGKLQELSRVLDAKYFRLEELKAETIVNTLNIALDPKSR
ncbi:MAG: VWA domain-containing protein [Bacteroidetes bacterium]|nr:VWA domain-containing protein [Bacteroidota bacterium]